MEYNVEQKYTQPCPYGIYNLMKLIKFIFIQNPEFVIIYIINQ